MNRCVCLLLFLLAANYSHAGDTREAEVKASYILKFCNYVTWPETKFSNGNAPLVVGVYGNNPFESVEFEKRAQNRRLDNGRRVEVRFINRIEDCQGCHIVFVGSSEANKLPQILSELHANHILTISDIENFCEKGGILELYPSQGRIRFAINPEEVQRAILKISSELLKLAKIVKTKQ